MHARLLTATALSALIALAGCGGDDDTAVPGTDTDIAGDSPGQDTAAEDGGATDGNGCPLLSDADAAQAVGVETLASSDGGDSDLCSWKTPDGARAFTVYKTDPFPPKSMTDTERAKDAGINSCLTDPRPVEVADGAAVACDAGSTVYGHYFINGQQYNVEVGDTSDLSPDDAEVAARIDRAANVIAKLKLPDS